MRAFYHEITTKVLIFIAKLPRNMYFLPRNYSEIRYFYLEITTESVILATNLPRNLVIPFVAVPRNIAKFTMINFCPYAIHSYFPITSLF